MQLQHLHDLFVHELNDLYDAEHQLTKALPKMANKAEHPQLKAAFEDHLVQTQGQIDRLEQVFQQLGLPAKGETCLAMKGLVAEAEKLMGENADKDVLDAGLIAAAQKNEHYEIASYGTLRAWAEAMGQHQVASLLAQSLEEEEATDRKLTVVAKQAVNVEAMQT